VSFTNHIYSVFNTVVQLYRSQKLRQIEPTRLFQPSDLAQALKAGSERERRETVVLSFQDPGSKIKYLPLQFETVFHPRKTYFLVGCLGGLGRSISKWMVKRGARRMIFLSRSGTDSPVAANLVSDLEEMNCSISVIRGDVGKYSDVLNALSVVNGPIGGVVHAAMGLHVRMNHISPNSSTNST